MSELMLSDPTMLRVIAHYLRSLESRCSRVLMCAGVLDQIAENVALAQGHHDHMIEVVETLAGTPGLVSHVETIAHAVVNGLPAWLTTPHGGRS